MKQSVRTEDALQLAIKFILVPAILIHAQVLQIIKCRHSYKHLILYIKKDTKDIQITYTDIFIDEGYISKEMCKQDEREFLSDFDICNKGESIGNRDKNCTIFINV